MRATIEHENPLKVQKRGRGRPPSRRASITLALPPYGGSRTPAYLEWRGMASGTIAAARLQRVPGLFAVEIRAGFRGRSEDVSRLAAPILDALRFSEVVDAEANPTRLMVEGSAKVELGAVCVSIRQFPPPEARRREFPARRRNRVCGASNEAALAGAAS